MKKIKILVFTALIILSLGLIACSAPKAVTFVVPPDHICEDEQLEDKGSSTKLDSAYFRDEQHILEGFNNMYHPTVVKIDFDKEYPYRMFLMGWAANATNVGWPGCDATFLMRGKNLYEWEIFCKENRTQNAKSWWQKVVNGKADKIEKWAPVLYANPDNWYDNWHVGDASIVYKDSTFFLAYSSYCFDKDGIMGGQTGDTDGDLSCIMGATSTDGINWTKSTMPILLWQEELGKKEPVTSDGSDFVGKNFYGLYHRPSIIYDEGMWKMWFDYMVNDKMSMGYATNEGDFLNPKDWKTIKSGATPALANYTNPEVKKIDGKYLAYADPSVDFHGIRDDRMKVIGKDPTERGWVTRQLVEAQSSDGINWKVTGYISPDSDRPANHVPVMYIEDNHLFLYYATQIGYSGQDSFLKYKYEYDSIRVARRCISKIVWRV